MELEAGVNIPLEALWINGNRVLFRRLDSKVVESFELIHDAFFFGLPEVDYHADARQVTVMKGNYPPFYMVIESFRWPFKDLSDVQVERVSFITEEEARKREMKR